VLVAELNHRVRNMLAVAVSLAKQTLSGDRPTQELREAFIGRLHSMANAYTLISRENWGDVALGDILNVEFEPHRDGPSDRVKMEGPQILCRPASALSLSLVIHELVTNAVKHGALAQADGRVAVSWSVEDDKLALEWREVSSRPYEPTERKGLGTKLIERQIKSFPGASLKLDHRSDGLQARFVISIEDLFVPLEGGE
jgi:two-component system, chemotaxis family, CheB/CheR fusion protein